MAEDDLSARRELMAAGLNSSMALQKGLCAIHAICNAITAVSRSKPSPSAIGGILIPHLVDLYEDHLGDSTGPVKSALRLGNSRRLGDGLREILSSWPVPRRLSDLSIELSALGKAAEIASVDRAISNAPLRLHRKQIRDILVEAH